MICNHAHPANIKSKHCGIANNIQLANVTGVLLPYVFSINPDNTTFAPVPIRVPVPPIDDENAIANNIPR